MSILFFSTLPNLSTPEYQQKWSWKPPKTLLYSNICKTPLVAKIIMIIILGFTFLWHSCCSVLWVLFLYYYSKLSVATSSHESLIIWKFILFCSNNILRIFIIKTDLGTMNHRCQGVYLKECDEINKTNDSEEEKSSLWKGRRTSIQ